MRQINDRVVQLNGNVDLVFTREMPMLVEMLHEVILFDPAIIDPTCKCIVIFRKICYPKPADMNMHVFRVDAEKEDALYSIVLFWVHIWRNARISDC